MTEGVLARAAAKGEAEARDVASLLVKAVAEEGEVVAGVESAAQDPNRPTLEADVEMCP